MARPRVTRLRQLTSGQTQRLEGLRSISRLLDSAFLVPGTSYRIGLDPILGLVPGIGDLVSPLFTIGILWQGRDLGIPRIIQLRMTFNVAIDTLAGVVPVIGDLFDFAWKANDKNLALLEQYAYEEKPASHRDWFFVGGLTLVLFIMAILPLVLVGWLIAALGRILT